MRATLLTSAAAILALGSACATSSPRADAAKCPESRGHACLSTEVCSYDRDRGCELCLCSPANRPPMYPPDLDRPVAR